VRRDDFLDTVRHAVPFGKYLLEGTALTLFNLVSRTLVGRNCRYRVARNDIDGYAHQMCHRVADSPPRTGGHGDDSLFLARAAN
jgi:hypothetical protein